MAALPAANPAAARTAIIEMTTRSSTKVKPCWRREDGIFMAELEWILSVGEQTQISGLPKTCRGASHSHGKHLGAISAVRNI
jgi:hypothetical protein